MSSHPTGEPRCQISESIEIAIPIDDVFECWNDYEEFPRVMESVRRVKRIGEQQILWDVDIAGRQFVWEARIVESVRDKLVRWTSTWGFRNCGEVRFEALADDRTLISVDIHFEPRNLIERIGAHLGIGRLHVRRDLRCFRQFVEYTTPREARS